MDESNQASGQAPDSSAAPQRAEDLENSAVVGNGLFSTAETSVETENLPPELGGSALEQPAPVLPQGNSSRISSAFGGGAASRSRTSGANPNFANNPNFTSSTIDSDINLAPTQPKKKSKLPIIIIIAILILGGAGGGFWFLAQSGIFDKKEEPIVGATNFDYLFDESAPIPAQEGDQYGYLDPANGGWLITPQFLSATNFYGDYAAVTYTQSNVPKNAIINRSGDTVILEEGNAVNFRYDTQNNIWLIGTDIYNSSMQKINADGTTGNYLGYGYMLSSIVSERPGEADKIETDKTDTDSSSDSDSESSSSSGGTQTEMRGRIVDLEGNVHYDCQAFCVAQATSDKDGNIYAVVRNWGKSAKIISLPSGDVLYTAGGANSIQVVSGTIFAEIANGARRYLKMEDGKVVITNNPDEIANTLTNSSEYYAEECNGRNSILKRDGTTISKCDVMSYIELPKSVYEMYQHTFSKDPLFVWRLDKVDLIDLRDGSVIQSFGAGDIITFENSPFFSAANEAGDIQVCNILKTSDNCITVKDGNSFLEGFGNYFTLTSEDSVKIYNAKLELIHE